jgi:hypothetical protein
MSRANIYRYPEGTDYLGEPEFAGWFDPAKAEQWSDADYNGNGSGGTGRGQALFRTSGGMWVLCNWSRWQGESDTFTYVTETQARDWLLRNHEDEAVTKHFGEITEEEDRRPGRPAIGDPVNVRFDGDLLARIDAHAAENGQSRAEAVRVLVTLGLHAATRA